LHAIPELLARVADLMSEFPATWAFCGGWSVDAWLGDLTRDHSDVDLTIFHEEQIAVFDYFTTGWLLNGHDSVDGDGTAAWTGRVLEFPAHIHAYSEDGFDLDIQLNRRRGGEWVFSTKAGLTLPIAHCIRDSPWGVPTLAPEAILFYKAIGWIRPHDETDFQALLPTLSKGEREWLYAALLAVRPEHAWLKAF
jgi:hypothetical protein